MKRKTLVCICVILIFVGILGVFGVKLLDGKDKGKEKEVAPEIKYELKDVGNNSYELYIDGVKVDGVNHTVLNKDSIYKLSDALLIVYSTSFDEVAIVNANREVKDITLKTKFDLKTISKVEKNDIYVESVKAAYSQDDSLLCSESKDTVVYAKEKITYQGKGNFSDATTVETKTRTQYDTTNKCK